MPIYDYKALFFEVFAAGFEACLTGKDIHSGYEDFYQSIIEEALYETA